MSRHLERALEHLRKDILSIGRLVEETINKATIALEKRDILLTQEVLKGDDQIDQMEVEIEEECLKILALHQPVAGDLRFIIAVLKVNCDLERMADLAVNIAERAHFLIQHEPLGVPLDFAKMVESCRLMVRSALDALVQQDVKLARRVILADDEVDRINAQMFEILEEHMQNEPKTISRAVHYLSVSRHIERIADSATNIAEDVIFMVEGEVMRHHVEDYMARSSSTKLPSL